MSILGFGSGVVAGLLGVSGAVVTIPLLLYGPPLLGLGELTVRTVAAIAVVQGLFASSSAIIAHRRTGYVNRRIAVVGGVLAATGALAGGVLSKWVPEIYILAIFGIILSLATMVMLFPVPGIDLMGEAEFRLRRPWRLGIFFPEGVMAGMVGIGAGVVTMPILNRFIGVPLRIAIGSNLAVTWFAVMAGFVGKAATGQVPLGLSVAVLLGTIPGAQVGAALNHHLPARYLRYLFVALLVVIAVRIWLEVLARAGIA